MASLKTIFDTCKPRAEVLTGELKEQEFAASLTKVLRGDADAVYQDPSRFFNNTYPTSGLKALLAEALGRLTGAKPSNSPVIRLETSFGGGKTHSLIALYHVCREPKLGAVLKPFVAPSLLPKAPIEKIAGIVGPDLEAAERLDHGDCQTSTMWGEIAYQIGGKKAYQAMRESDEARIAPGTSVWQKVIGEGPCLVMIDEIAYYLRVARGAQYKVGGTSLAEQTVAGLMSLLKFASEHPSTVVVLTLADSSDAFGKESDDLRGELQETQRLTARQEHIVTPAQDDEISAIVTHRLFERIDRKAAEQTADAYAAYYRAKLDQQVDLPPRAVRSEYRDEIVTDYPFHPDFLTTLNRKTSTIHNFQKARGALRLLAATVRELWNTRPANTYLIHSHDLDLGREDIANDLTSRLDRPQFKQVIEADIASPKKGSLSHAQEIDRDWIEAGKPPYARRVATTVFLHSLVQTGQSGVDPADLRLAVLQPTDDPALIDKATQKLVDTCWFFDWDGFRYRFKTEPSLRKIVDDEMQMVGRVRAKGELDERIRKVWKKGTLVPVFFPHEAAELDDDAGPPKLAVIHYDAATTTVAEPAPPELVLKLFEHTGTQEGYRTYKNNVFFLVTDGDQIERMVEVAQRYLAIRRITSEPERMSEFNEEQAKKLKNMAEAAELDMRVAITRAYRILFYPSADAPKKSGNLACELLPPQDQGDVEKDQSEVVLRVLKNLDKVLTADDSPLSAQYLKAKAWPLNAPSITTEDLRKAFAQRLSLKVLLDVNQLKRTVKDGTAKGIWVYYPADEAIGYGPDSPAPMVEISEDVTLYTPEEAKRLGIRLKGEKVEEKCPACGNMPCTCGEEEDGKRKRKRPQSFSAEGTPAQAFQSIADQAHDGKVSRLSRLRFRIEGMSKDAAKDARSIGLAIPQMGKAEFKIQQKLVLEFGEGEAFDLTFNGSWDRYKRVKSLTDSLSQEASKASVRMNVEADFADGLDLSGDMFQMIRDVLDSLGIGKIGVEAETGPASPPPRE